MALAARVTLASVFAYAAVGKATDPRSSPMVRSGASAELLLVAGLLANSTADLAAAGALVVLVGGVARTLATLAQGRRTPCRCLGRWSRAQLGWREVARNCSLALLAGLVAARGSVESPGLAAWCTVVAITGAGLLCAVVIAHGRRRAALRLVDQMIS